MKHLNQRLGCGLWLVGLLAALFAGEWLVLWLVIRTIPQERLIPMVMVVIVATIIIGSAVVYFRIQRRLG